VHWSCIVYDSGTHTRVCLGFFVFLFSLALVVSNFGVEWGFLRSLILMCWVLSPILCGVGCKTLI